MKEQFISDIRQAVHPFNPELNEYYESCHGQKYFCVDVKLDESDLEFKEEIADAINKVLKYWADANSDDGVAHDKISIGIPVDENWERPAEHKDTKAAPQCKVRPIGKKDVVEAAALAGLAGMFWFGGEVAKDYISTPKDERSFKKSIKKIGKNKNAWFRTVLVSVLVGCGTIGVKGCLK